MIAALAIALAAATSAPALKDVEEKLAREKAAAARLAAKETNVLEAVAEAERDVAAEYRNVKLAEKKAKDAGAKLAGASASEAAAHAALKSSADAIAPRLRARYRLGREGFVRLLVGAPTLGDLLQRRRLFDAVLKKDLELLAELRLRADAARTAHDVLVAAKAEADDAIAGEKARRAALAERAADEARLLAVVRSQKAVHEKAALELEAARAALQKELDALPKAAPGAVDFATLKGKLAWPAKGRVEVPFGKVVDPRFHTVSLQKGIDLRAAPGTPVVAVAPGRVVHAGWFRGYGNLVIIDHGGGYYTLFAHLGAMTRAKDDHVEAGDAIGEVGDTGSLKGAYLYFEIRKAQTPLDPRRWLGKRR